MLLICCESRVEVELDGCKYVACVDAAVRNVADRPCVVEADGVSSGIKGFHCDGICEGRHFGTRDCAACSELRF